jgi:uroporphyrin-3 C-methyltransferase
VNASEPESAVAAAPRAGAASASAPSGPSGPPAPAAPAEAPRPRWLLPALVAATLLGAAGVYGAWQSQQRLQSIERELVRRQQDSDSAATEARVLANQAQDAARDAAARVALLDARVSEAAAMRTQVEDQLLALTRSRDDQLLAEIETTLRLAGQQAELTGSAGPLVQALRHADERLARLNQPRLERVRRAIARDLERASAAAGADVATLALRLDDVLRQVDELPLLSRFEARRDGATAHDDTAGDAALPQGAAAPAKAASSPAGDWVARATAASGDLAARVWREAKSLLRVTRIEQPEALLLSPDQSYFVRENLKLRLLNARLALLARQFDVAQADLAQAQASLGRYFDRRSRRVQGAIESLQQVALQSGQVATPRADDTLAVLAAASVR